MHNLFLNTIVISASGLVALITLLLVEGNKGAAIALVLFAVFLCVFNKLLRNR